MKDRTVEIIERIELGDLTYEAFANDSYNFLFVYFNMENYTFIRVSINCKRLLGYEAEELEGRKFMDFVVDSKESIETVNINRDTNDSIYTTTNTYIKKSGEHIVIDWQMLAWDKHKSLCIGKLRT